MPPRSPFTPGRLPRWFIRFCRLPQRKIKRIALLLLSFLLIWIWRSNPSACACLHFAQISFRKSAVVCKLLHAVVNITLNGIGVVFVYERLNNLTNSWDMLCNARIFIGIENVESANISKVSVNVAITHRLHRASFFSRPIQNLVINIGKVLHIAHLVALPLQIAPQHIPSHIGTGMAQVAIVIYRHPTAIHRHLPFLNRNKRVFLASECVVKSETHVKYSCVSTHLSPVLRVIAPDSKMD